MKKSFQTTISPLALTKIIYHASSNPKIEVAGLLIGNYSSGHLAIVDTATGHQVGSRASVELTPAVQAKVAEKLMEHRRKNYIVGWYHSHPNIGIFMSGTDIHTQQNYQYFFPYAVALVIDPGKFLKTGKISDIDFKVFHVDDKGSYFEVGTKIDCEPWDVVTSLFQYMSEEVKPLKQVEKIENLIIRTLDAIKSIIENIEERKRGTSKTKT